MDVGGADTLTNTWQHVIRWAGSGTPTTSRGVTVTMSFKMAADKRSPVGKGGITDPGLSQPLVFANSQRLFKFLGALFSAGKTSSLSLQKLE